MRTYYVYGRLWKEGFHLTARLSTTAPPHYFAIKVLEAKSKPEAIRQLLNAVSWLPPDGKGREFSQLHLN